MEERMLESCNLCPRGCRVNRVEGLTGRCGETAEVRIARAGLHMWEEPCISGQSGSGTVFFCGCPLGCVYCQNYGISRGEHGVPVTEEELSQIFRKLQDKKANNINLVTPTHFIPQIIGALQKAREDGLTLPVVYNTASYERTVALELMEGLVQIYLPDLKYYDSSPADRYSNAPDYFKVASAAVAEMVRQVGEPVFRPDGIMEKGVIVRHLLLPGGLEDSKKVVRYLWETYGNSIWVSLMSQYTPMPQVSENAGKGPFPELARKVTQEEYDELVDFAAGLGMTQVYVQEGEAASESFIPDFENFDIQKFLEE